ncbi:MAG TPA: OB-fold nucleic acid binding domain-containing protein, partial [Blastocatellia bacterium]|nr:OB-fold nucleic acid binding domain-containing protein [Blastocatellia bacterium]
GEADLVRRAMGKKKREELDKHKEKFLKQATERGHNHAKLEKLWQSFEGFADYAFNRAHSFSYGYLAYQTAYLKAHHPTHFWAAVLSNELNSTDKVVKYINEARSSGIPMLPPDVDVSLNNFTAGGNSIRFGLAAIKGIGQSVVSSIIEARTAGGRFKSLYDFTERVDSKSVNKRALESLIKAGAFDTLGHRRAQLFASIDSAIESGQRLQRSRETGQGDLFAALAMGPQAVAEPPMPDVPEWTPQELLRGEKETLGFYISGHPLSRHEDVLKQFATTDMERIGSQAHGDKVSVGGIVMELAVKITKKGDKFALFQLEDQFGSIKIVAWPDVFGRIAGGLENDRAVLVKGRLEIDDSGSKTIVAEDAGSLENIRERVARGVVIHMPSESVDAAVLDRLGSVLDANRGEAPVIFNVELPDGDAVRVRPNQFIKVKITPALADSIKNAVSQCRVELTYERERSAVA